MPLCSRQLRRRPEVARRHRADRPGARPAAQGGRDVEGAVPVSRREDTVVQRERRQGVLPLLRLRRRRRRDQVRRAERQGQLPRSGAQLAARAGITVPEAEDAKQDAESSREREALLKAHEVAAAWFREQLAAPVGAAGRRLLADRGMTDETIALLGMGFAPAAGGLRARLLKEGFAEPLLLKSGLLVQRDDGPGARSVPQPADDSDLPRQRRDHRVRRPGHGRRAAAEIPEFAGNRDLREGPDALRPAPGQTRHQPAEIRGARRGILRLGAGLPGGHHERGRLFGHGADARRRASCCAGSPAKWS